MFESEFLSNPESRERYQQLIERASAIVSRVLPEEPYCGMTPSQLAKLADRTILPAEAANTDEWAATLHIIVENSIHVAHPHTAAHLHCPPLLASLAAEVVISALNQSMDSFDQAPIATMAEQNVIRWLCSEAGFPSSAGGTFTAGGSQSNYMGLLLARDAFVQRHWNRSVQKDGLPPDAHRLRILCSDVAHFTVEKSAAQLGLGTSSVLRVESDQNFRMKPDALRAALNKLATENLLPMAVVATAGTTDFGSIDPIPELLRHARAVGAWLHVDAAYGGALLFSVAHRPKLEGIADADSISIDFHKLLWQPIPCSVFLLRDAANFAVLKMHAEYLNPEEHEQQGIPDLVTSSLLTSRRFDALKLWIAFQSLGREKLAAMIDHTIALANHAAGIIRRTANLELACDPQLSTVVFRYVPQQRAKKSSENGMPHARPERSRWVSPQLRDMGPSESSLADSGIDADQINAAIKQNLFARGQAVIGLTRVHDRQFLKFTCMNPSASEADFTELVQLIAKEGRSQERD